MALKHKPSVSLLASSDASSINQILANNADVTAITVFRRIGNNQQVAVTVLGLNSDNTPSSATDYEVDLERSLDAGDSWVVHKTFTGPSSEDVPYPNGAVLWRFRLVAKGTANKVRIQAIA